MDRRRSSRRQQGHRLRLEPLSGRYAVCRVAAGADVSWAAGDLVVISRSKGESVGTTVICDESSVPTDKVEHDAGWRAMRLGGSFGFGEVGVLSSVLGPLAEAGVPTLSVGTFETDYVLVKSERFDRVREALEEVGHVFDVFDVFAADDAP